MPLERKIQISQTRIIEWYNYYHGNVVVSFSGGKDSTVLLHLVRSVFPNVKAVFSNTGLEYPEIQKHVMSIDNVDIVRPSMRFDEVISTYGYPLIGKNVGATIYYARRLNGNAQFKRNRLMGKRNPKDKLDKSMFDNKKWLPLCEKTPFLISHFCCNKIKKEPIHNYERKNNLKSFVASLTEESMMRRTEWIRNGCNAFNSTNQISKPLSFWTEQDILAYIVKYNLPIASVYGDVVSVHDGVYYPAKDMTGQIGCNLKCTGCDRTGCIFCGFGFHLEKKGETRFQRLAKTHPRQYEYSIGGGNGWTIPTMILQLRSMTANGKTGIRKKSGCRQRKVLVWARFSTWRMRFMEKIFTDMNRQ